MGNEALILGLLDYFQKEKHFKAKQKQKDDNLKLFQSMVGQDEEQPQSAIPDGVQGTMGLPPPTDTSAFPQLNIGGGDTAAQAPLSPTAAPPAPDNSFSAIAQAPSAPAPAAGGMMNMGGPSGTPTIPGPVYNAQKPQYRIQPSYNTGTGALTLTGVPLTDKEAVAQYLGQAVREGMPITQAAFHAMQGKYPVTKEVFEGMADPLFRGAMLQYRKYYQSQAKEKNLSPSQIEYLSALSAQEFTGGYAPDTFENGVLSVPRKGWEAAFVEDARKNVQHMWAPTEAVDKANESRLVQEAQNVADIYTKPLTGEMLAATGGRPGDTFASLRDKGLIYLDNNDIKAWDGYNSMFTIIDGLGATINKIYEKFPQGGLMNRLKQYAHMTISELRQAQNDDLAIALADYQAAHAQLFAIGKALGNTGTPSNMDMALTIDGFPKLTGLPDSKQVAFSKLSGLRNAGVTNLKKLTERKASGHTIDAMEKAGQPRVAPDQVEQGKVGAATGTVQSAPSVPAAVVEDPDAAPYGQPGPPIPDTVPLNEGDNPAAGTVPDKAALDAWWAQLAPEERATLETVPIEAVYDAFKHSQGGAQ